jgi:hypothetical protein
VLIIVASKPAGVLDRLKPGLELPLIRRVGEVVVRVIGPSGHVAIVDLLFEVFSSFAESSVRKDIGGLPSYFQLVR